MKSRRAKAKPGSTSTAQLDLFSLAASAASRPQVVRAIEVQAISPGPPERLTAPESDPLVAYVLGKQGRGRPEKVPNIATDVADQRRLLDVREAAIRLGLSKSTLDKMRCSGRGPRFIRATDRAIRYDPADLQAFADDRRRRSTSELAEFAAE